MEYQKMINLLDNTPNWPSKFRTKIWVKINDDSHGTYNTNSQIKFETSMLKSSLCDYSDAYIVVKGTISVVNTADAEVIFKNCAPFTDYISEINKTKIYNAKDIDVVMPMYNLIEHSYNYSKTLNIKFYQLKIIQNYCKQLKSGFKRTIFWNRYQYQSNNASSSPIFRLLNWS